MSLTVGIDLGTSTSEIAVFRDGNPQLVRDVRNSRGGILPSAVALGPLGDLIVGDAAYRNPAGVRQVKRHMGTDRSFELGGKTYRAEEISARILRHLKDNVERVCGEEVADAVITVPHAFKDRERRATMDAGELAGINVERIINEPTAAALAYGLTKLEHNQHVVVYDLGGGTLDVSVLEMFKGVLEVKASSGDPHLGGMDFDERLVQLIAEEIEREHGLKVDLGGGSGDRTLLEQVRAHAERAKVELSSQDAAAIDIPFLGDRSIGIHTVLTRREFDIASHDLVEKTGESIKSALRDAKLKPDEVDVVILVGGSTRIPAVRQFVSDFFGGRSLPEHVPPDEAVALGAAIQSALTKHEIDPSRGMIATDVTSHSLGVAVLEVEAGVPIPDRMSVIVPRQTTVPVRRTQQYMTSSDNQEAVHIRIYQGEHQDVSKNQLLDEVRLSGVPPGPAHSEAVAVRFELGVNQVLDVHAEIVSTGKSAAIRIEPSGARMTVQQKEEAADRIDEEWKTSRFLKRVEPLLAAAKRAKAKLNGADLGRVEELEDRLKAALAANDEEAIDELDRELTDVLFDLQ